MIHFLIGLFVVGLIIAGMVSSPAFRNFVIVVIILIAGGFWWLIDSSNKSSEQYRAKQAAEERFAATAIKATDLKVDDVKFKKASYGLSDYILEGVVTNNSAYQLGTMYFEVVLTDCLNQNCRVVGQESTSASAPVPAGQVRSFSSYALKFNNLPPLNGATRSWTYKITSLRSG
jgi:hypothetical protein